MKKSEVEIGKTYIISFHDGTMIPATVLRATSHQYGGTTRQHLTPPRTVRYDCRNERSGHGITVKSAAKFRAEVKRYPDGTWRAPARDRAAEDAIITLYWALRQIPPSARVPAGENTEEVRDARNVLYRAAGHLLLKNQSDQGHLGEGGAV